MGFERYVERGLPNNSILAFRWEGNNYSDIVDFLNLYRPNTNWTVTFGGDGNRYPTFFKSGVNKGGPAPGDWVLCVPWNDTSTPAYSSDLSFHTSREKPVPPLVDFGEGS